MELKLKRNLVRDKAFQYAIDQLAEHMGISHVDMGYNVLELGVIYGIMCRQPHLSMLDHRDGLLKVVRGMYDRLFDDPDIQAAHTTYIKVTEKRKQAHESNTDR